MKNIKRFVFAGILVMCVFSSVFQYAKANGASLDESAETTDSTSHGFLTVNGTEIVDENGDEVLLRGFNIGGWLIQEYWMTPVTGTADIEQWTNLETLEILEARFGQEKRVFGTVSG